MSFGIYVKHKAKWELHGVALTFDHATAQRAQIMTAAKANGYPAPQIIIRAESGLDDLPQSF